MNPRQTAALALLEMDRREGYSNLTLEPRLQRAGFSPQDRAFCSALFYGVLERRITLDWTIAHYSRTPIQKLEPEVLAALRLGALQLMEFPSVPPAAAVSQSVEVVRGLGKEKAAGFVNGLLRAMARNRCAVPPPKDKLTALSVEHSVPAPLIQLWRRAYGHDAALEILQGSRGPAPTFLRVNTTKTTPAALMARLLAEGRESRAVPGVENALELMTPGGLAGLPSFREGLFHVQDLSSQLCAAALAPEPGMAVLDLCAAPGGKTFTVAELLEDRGRVLARDLHPHRVKLVEEGAARLGLASVAAETGDALCLDPALEGKFDRVLCDVVCSGFGTLRRKPEIRYKPLDSLDGLPEVQYNILENASHYLKRGGRMVYSTCTLSPAENEEVVARFLGSHPEFSAPVPAKTYIHGREGLDCDGFFAAVLEKEGEP